MKDYVSLRGESRVIQAHKQTDGHTHTHTHRHTGGQVDQPVCVSLSACRQAHRLRGRQADRQADRLMGRQTDRQTGTQA